jgi:hypothetical protein
LAWEIKYVAVLYFRADCEITVTIPEGDFDYFIEWENKDHSEDSNKLSFRIDDPNEPISPALVNIYGHEAEQPHLTGPS